MFPIRDENPQLNLPIITYALIAINVLVWLVVQGMGAEPALSASICQFGMIPADLSGHALNTVRGYCPIDGQASWFTALSSMFMHGGWMHIIGNLWFLWIFGNNVEDAMGSARFLLFYLLCGFAAAGTQFLFDAASPVPMVGASGAIGGVMGAYIVLYPRVHVHMLVFLGFLFFTFAMPAIAMLGYWIVMQLIGGYSSIGGTGGGTAFWAHIGGFAAGMGLIFVFKDEALLAQHPYRGWHQREHPDRAWKKVQQQRGRWQ